MNSLKKGNLQSVTFVKDGQEVKHYIEANPQFKTLNVYDADQKRLDTRQGKDQKETQQEGRGQKESSKTKAIDKDDDTPGAEKEKKQRRKSRGV